MVGAKFIPTLLKTHVGTTLCCNTHNLAPLWSDTNFTSRSPSPSSQKAGLPRGGGVKETLPLMNSVWHAKQVVV